MKFERVATSEFYPDQRLGAFLRGVANQDVQNLTWPSSSFDLVTSNQVFEHVPDDVRGFRECYRVLKLGGALIFTVPLFDTRTTESIARIEAGKVIFEGEPEFHDSRIRGPQSEPVFWHHSKNDIIPRVASAGFRFVEIAAMRVAPWQEVPASVIYAVK
jgi:SAM-dependent methyltransferase